MRYVVAGVEHWVKPVLCFDACSELLHTEQIYLTMQPCRTMRFRVTYGNTTLVSCNRDVNEFKLNITVFAWIFQIKPLGCKEPLLQEGTSNCSIDHKDLWYRQTHTPYIHKYERHMHPPTTHTIVDIHRGVTTATGSITRWPKALTALMRVDHIVFVERG